MHVHEFLPVTSQDLNSGSARDPYSIRISRKLTKNIDFPDCSAPFSDAVHRPPEDSTKKKMSKERDMSKQSLDFLRTSLIDYCLAHGLVVRPQASVSDNPNHCLVSHAPVALYPTDFPGKAFEHAKAIQKDYNELYAKIASNESFLTKIMNELKDVDDFMRQLWEMYLDVKEHTTSLTLGLFRSDYLLHAVDDNSPTIKQVEFNTISASFGSLATRTSELHRAMHQLGAYDDLNINAKDLPINPALQGLASGLAVAHKHYISDRDDACGIAFIVQSGERNAFDQRWLEYDLLETHGIKSWRVPFTEVQEQLSVAPETKRLFIKPQSGWTSHEITVVYYRSGYGPEDYVSEKEWESRKMLELSTAVKCPSIITQLAGSKKVQQVLSEPGVLKNFLDVEAAKNIESTFVGMHTLDSSSEGKKAAQIALQKPDKYVLKPQREGGGHNIYRSAIPDFLRSIPESHWSGYILMELIEPPEVHNAIVRAGEIFPASVISELGIYGTILWDSSGILYNEEVGHLLRTKSKETDEGGVAAGFAVIDSPHLI